MYLCTQNLRTLNNLEWRKIQLHLQVLNLFCMFSVIHISKLFLCQNKGLPVNAKLPLCMPWKRVWVAKVYLHIFLTLALEAGKCLTSHFDCFTPSPRYPLSSRVGGPQTLLPTSLSLYWLDFVMHSYSVQWFRGGTGSLTERPRGTTTENFRTSVYCRLLVDIHFW
jgi:hypothetical protein